MIGTVSTDTSTGWEITSGLVAELPDGTLAEDCVWYGRSARLRVPGHGYAEIVTFEPDGLVTVHTFNPWKG